MTYCSQLSLVDIYKNCQDLMITDRPAFFSLLEEHLDLSEFIPINFYNAHYQKKGVTGFIVLVLL